MKFTKMEGIGNDYVYIGRTKGKISNPTPMVIDLSDRHFGIGSDGVIMIEASDKADFFMNMYNADGTQSEMCGNGIRCVAKYVYDHKLTDKTSITIDTLAGVKYLDLIVNDGKVTMVTVDMGEPELIADKVPVISDKDKVIDDIIEVEGKEYRMTCVSVGNPHAVVFVEDVDTFPLEQVGPLFEHHKAFPHRVNAEFVQIVDRHTVKMRVWERGTGETLACGTGACATTVAAILNGHTDEEITVILLGGDLKIRWNRENNRIYMTGPATTVDRKSVV